jgi:hypothetical protein
LKLEASPKNNLEHVFYLQFPTQLFVKNGQNCPTKSNSQIGQIDKANWSNLAESSFKKVFLGLAHFYQEPAATYFTVHSHKFRVAI